MQLICGQCGKLHGVKPGPGILAARCDRCRHEIQIGHLVAPPLMTDEQADEQTMFGGEEGGFYMEARRSLRERLLVICGNCGGQMKLSKRMAGQISRCPTCGRDVRVPFLEEEDEYGDHEFGTGPKELVASNVGTGQAVEHRRAKLKPEQIRRHRREKAILLTIGLLAAGMLIAILMLSRGKDDGDRSIRGGTGNPGDAGWGAPASTDTVKHSLIVGKPRWQGFAGAGRFPAGAGMLYVAVPVRFEAKGAALQLASVAESIELETASGVWKALGTMPRGASWVTQAVPASLSLADGHGQDLVLLFEIPAEETRARLRVPREDLAAEVTLPAPLDAEASLAGTFRERAPRNLRPLLRDPVMAALQQTPAQTLVVEVKDQAVHVELPEADVHGDGRISAEGTAKVELHHGDARLDAMIRLLPEGLVVLSLRDEPMYQLTFTPPNLPKTPTTPRQPSPIFRDNPREPTIFGN